MLAKVIALEGVDGSGKSTQVKRVAAALEQEIGSVQTYSAFSIAPQLTQLLPVVFAVDPPNIYATQLIFALGRALAYPSCLTASRLALFDRHKFSSRVYAEQMGLPEIWSKTLEGPLPDPDLTLLLDVDPEVAMQRRSNLDGIEADLALQRRCRESYLAIARSQTNWVVIDGTGAPDNVTMKLVEHIRLYLGFGGTI